MQTAEYASVDPAKRSKVTNLTTFVKCTLKNFASDDKPVIVNTKKYTAYNKSPSAIKIFSRTKSAAVDVTLSANALDIFAVSFDNDAFGVVLSTGSVVIYRVQELADQSLAAQETKLVIPDNIVAATVVNPQADKAAVAIAAISSANVVFYVTGVLEDPQVKPLGSIKGTSAAQYFRAGKQLIAVAHAHGEVQLFDFDPETGAGWKSALSKPWFPQGDDAISGFHVFTKKAGNASRILTGSNGNNELRLWSLEKGAVSLIQTINVKNADGASPSRLLVVDMDDALVYLPVTAPVTTSATSPAPAGGLIVFALGDSLTLVRGTEWNIDAAVCAAPAVLKVKSDIGETRYERAFLSRTATEINRVILESKYLEGGPNLGPEAPAAAAAAANANDVRKWFEQPAVVASPQTAVVAPPPPRYVPFAPQVTEISSNGQSTTTTKFDSALVEKQLRDALREREESIAASYSALNEGVKQLERLASQTAAAIRQPQIVQRISQEVARKAAAQTFESCRSAAGSIAAGGPVAPVATESITPDMRSIDRFCEEIRVQGQRVAATILTQSMQRQLGGVVERSWATVMGPQEAKDIQLPKPTQLPSLQEFADVIDKAHASQTDLFRRQKESDSAKFKGITSRAVANAEQSLAANRMYFDKVKASVNGLSAAIKEAATASGPSSSGAMSEDAVVAAAVSLATAGRWKDSLKTAVDAGNPSVLIRYLESDVVANNRASVASENTLSVPIFVSIMQQLSSDLGASAGLMPLRIEWMMEFVMAFDHLTGDEQHRGLLRASAIHFSNILDSLKAIDERGQLDAGSRRSLKLIRKSVSSFAF